MYLIQSFKINQETYERIQKVRKEHSINFSDVIRKLLIDYLDKMEGVAHGSK